MPAGTVANYRRRYEKDGVIGLADHRPVRRTPRYGAVDDAVVDAMRQAMSEATDASTRTGTFLLWRTEQILKADESGQERSCPHAARFTGCWTSSPLAPTPPARRNRQITG
ncbi:hypothetical protein SRIMM317S_06563 [Streptomyces rimosus subsp. rimosus]